MCNEMKVSLLYSFQVDASTAIMFVFSLAFCEVFIIRTANRCFLLSCRALETTTGEDFIEEIGTIFESVKLHTYTLVNRL